MQRACTPHCRLLTHAVPACVCYTARLLSLLYGSMMRRVSRGVCPPSCGVRPVVHPCKLRNPPVPNYKLSFLSLRPEPPPSSLPFQTRPLPNRKPPQAATTTCPPPLRTSSLRPSPRPGSSRPSSSASHTSSTSTS